MKVRAYDAHWVTQGDSAQALLEAQGYRPRLTQVRHGVKWVLMMESLTVSEGAALLTSRGMLSSNQRTKRSTPMAKFSRGHYEMVAAVFKAEKPGDNWDANKRVQHNLLLNSMTRMFRQDNSGFLADKFVAAAGGLAP